MHYQRILSALAALGLAGCGTHLPELTSRQVLPNDVLVAAIHCELRHAVWEQLYEREGRSFLKTWQGAYTITLKADETGSLSADTNKFPATIGKSGSTVVTAVGADIKGTANRTALLKFSLDVADIKDRPPNCSEGTATASHPFLQGRIGFREWLNDALEAVLADNAFKRKPKNITTIGHTFEFIVTSNAAVTPVFTIVPQPITLNPAVTISREEDNSIDVVFSAPAKDGSSSTVVSKETSPGQKKKIAALTYLLSPPAPIAALLSQIETKRSELRQLNVEIPRDVFSARPESVRPEAQSSFSSLQTLTTQLHALPAFEEFKRNLDVAGVGENEIDPKSLQAKIENINANPEATTVTRTGGGVFPAAENPNIASAQLQLTLERVLGNAKLVGF